MPPDQPIGNQHRLDLQAPSWRIYVKTTWMCAWRVGLALPRASVPDCMLAESLRHTLHVAAGSIHGFRAMEGKKCHL